MISEKNNYQHPNQGINEWGRASLKCPTLIQELTKMWWVVHWINKYYCYCFLSPASPVQLILETLNWFTNKLSLNISCGTLCFYSCKQFYCLIFRKNRCWWETCWHQLQPSTKVFSESFSRKLMNRGSWLMPAALPVQWLSQGLCRSLIIVISGFCFCQNIDFQTWGFYLWSLQKLDFSGTDSMFTTNGGKICHPTSQNWLNIYY